MRSYSNSVVAVVLGVLVAALCTGGCKKSTNAEREEPERVANETATPPREEVIGEKNDYFTAVRREQLELRGRLQAEIDAIDRQLAGLKVDVRKDAAVDPRSKETKKIQDLLRRREQLVSDVAVVDRSDERGWDETKAEIERDLENKAQPGKI